MSYKASTTNARNNNTKTNTKQPFCKVCFDAKREDYNTHFLKDFSGPQPVVLCPYLLALKCNYCKEQGHTVSYCEILKAKNASENQASTRKETSQNGNFFILRTSSKDKETTITHAPSKTVAAVSKKSVSVSNKFALLEQDDEAWELPKYNKTKKSVSFTEEALVASEPETLIVAEEVSAFPSWAKIVSMPPPPKKAAAPIKEVLKKDMASLFVSSTQAEPANFEKPMPKFITPAPSSKPMSKTDKYFFSAPSGRSWADDDSSSSEDDGW
jgi:hypothetical protein